MSLTRQRSENERSVASRAAESVFVADCATRVPVKAVRPCLLLDPHRFKIHRYLNGHGLLEIKGALIDAGKTTRKVSGPYENKLDAESPSYE